MTENRLEMPRHEARLLTAVICLVTPENQAMGLFKEPNGTQI